MKEFLKNFKISHSNDWKIHGIHHLRPTSSDPEQISPWQKALADLGGCQGRPPGPNSFIFMQFLAKNWQNNPNLGIGAPPRENPGSVTENINILIKFIGF